jgi:hypothetical protein
MSTYGPAEQPPPPATNTASTSIRFPRWWNPWYALFSIFLAAYGSYVIFVLGRATHGSDDVVPRSLNAIVLTALSLGSILCYLAAGRLNRRRTDDDFRVAVIDVIRTVAQRSSDAKVGDNTTVDLAWRGSVPCAEGRVALVSAGTVYGPTGPLMAPRPSLRPRSAGDLGEAVNGRGAEAAPVKEAFMHGYRLGRQHSVDGVENVVPMPPAQGG